MSRSQCRVTKPTACFLGSRENRLISGGYAVSIGVFNNFLGITPTQEVADKDAITSTACPTEATTQIEVHQAVARNAAFTLLKRGRFDVEGEPLFVGNRRHIHERSTRLALSSRSWVDEERVDHDFFGVGVVNDNRASVVAKAAAPADSQPYPIALEGGVAGTAAVLIDPAAVPRKPSPAVGGERGIDGGFRHGVTALTRP